MINPTLHIHTHCQVAPTDTLAKTWQRVCLPFRTDIKRNNEGTTMYIKNKRDRCNIKVCSPFKLYHKLKIYASKSPIFS